MASTWTLKLEEHAGAARGPR